MYILDIPVIIRLPAHYSCLLEAEHKDRQEDVVLLMGPLEVQYDIIPRDKLQTA